MAVASCACGQLRAEVTGDPVRVSICHCTECRRRTGSAFSHNARFLPGQVRLSGADRSFTRTGDEGSRITYHFCPDCGVTVWYGNSDVPDMVAIPVGAFAMIDCPTPVWSVYDDRRPAWLQLDVPGLQVID